MLIALRLHSWAIQCCHNIQYVKQTCRIIVKLFLAWSRDRELERRDGHGMLRQGKAHERRDTKQSTREQERCDAETKQGT